jgi:hypothetical protein
MICINEIVRLLASPLRGRDERSSLLGVGGGGRQGTLRLGFTPSLTLPRKGGGKREIVRC